MNVSTYTWKLWPKTNQRNSVPHIEIIPELEYQLDSGDGFWRLHPSRWGLRPICPYQHYNLTVICQASYMLAKHFRWLQYFHFLKKSKITLWICQKVVWQKFYITKSETYKIFVLSMWTSRYVTFFPETLSMVKKLAHNKERF